MGKIDFDKPYFETEDFKWYLHENLTHYATTFDNHLPSLGNVGVFVVIGKDVKDMVMIDNKQNVLLTSFWNEEFAEDTFKTKLVALKTNKHFETSESKQIRKNRRYER